MPYTDVNTVKSYLGNVPPTIDDALLTGFVDAAQGIIDNYCHQPFEAIADTTRYFDPTCDTRDAGYYASGSGRQLWLDYPLIAITSVTNGDGAIVSPTEYVTEPRNLKPWYALSLKLGSAIYWTYTGSPENSIAIVGKWAYSLTAPADIQQAATRLAGYLYRQRDNGFDLDRMIQTQNGVVTPFGLPVDLRELLAPYKRIVV